jgi:hypothetical protein
MRETADMYPDSPFASTVHRWAKTLAASAQVREAEATRIVWSELNESMGHYGTPAPEPVPVAQGVADRLSWLARDAVIVADATCIDVSLAGFRDTMTQAIATIADHARIVADLQAQLHDQRWQHAQELKRAEQAEASLAACREDEAWTLYLQDWIGDAAVGVLRKEFKELHPSATNPNENQTP